MADRTCNPTRNPFTQQETPAVGVKMQNLTKNFGSLHVL